MFKGIVNSLFGKQGQFKPEHSFSERLNRINANSAYPLANIPIPDKFCDHIHQKFMDNPIVYDIAGHAMDYSQLDLICKKNEAGHYLNPYTNYKTEISLITDDFCMPDEEEKNFLLIKEKQNELKYQIELFVSIQEKIYFNYQQKRKLLTQKPKDLLQLLLINSDIEKELNFFINLISTIIENQEGVDDSIKLAEETEILLKPRAFLQHIQQKNYRNSVYKRHLEISQMVTENMIQVENAKNKNQKEHAIWEKKPVHFSNTLMKEFPIQTKLRKGLR